MLSTILKSIINKQRRDFEQLASSRHIPEKSMEGVRQARGIRYKQDGDPAHVMDMFIPNTVKIPTPVVINIHGGGLIMGNKEFNRHFCINLCKMGFIVFSVEYRLCPEVTVFQQLEDIYAAMNHIDGMMPQLKAELGHCYMVGDSAGAMLAMYASAIQRNPRLAKAAGIRPSYDFAFAQCFLSCIKHMYQFFDSWQTSLYTFGHLGSIRICLDSFSAPSVPDISYRRADLTEDWNLAGSWRHQTSC